MSRCGYHNNIKTKYVKHLNRKKLCNPILSNCNLEHEYIKYNIENKINNVSKNIKKNESTKSQSKVNQYPKMSQPKVNQKSTKTIYICNYCNKELSYKQSYYLRLSVVK